MLSVPAVSAVVVHAAVPELTVTAEQPLMVVPFELNATVPVGVGGPAGPTVAVKVTDCPTVDGFRLETTVVVEGAPAPAIATTPIGVLSPLLSVKVAV